MESPGDVTRLLLNLQAGDASAVEQLTPLVYGELRGLAGALLRRERQDHTLQATALVHEAYMKLVDQSQVSINTRAHFMAIAARVMRQILVDHARRHRSQKRGAGDAKLALDEALVGANERPRDVVELDEALQSLGALDERKARIIEMRFFGGMTGEEIAENLGVSTATVTRDLRMAQAWLSNYMRGTPQE